MWGHRGSHRCRLLLFLVLFVPSTHGVDVLALCRIAKPVAFAGPLVPFVDSDVVAACPIRARELRLVLVWVLVLIYRCLRRRLFDGILEMSRSVFTLWSREVGLFFAPCFGELFQISKVGHFRAV